MDERMRFVIRLKDGESMASLCREFGIALQIVQVYIHRQSKSDHATVRPTIFACPKNLKFVIFNACQCETHWAFRCSLRWSVLPRPGGGLHTRRSRRH
jgi:hypothetical protein